MGKIQDARLPQRRHHDPQLQKVFLGIFVKDVRTSSKEKSLCEEG